MEAAVSFHSAAGVCRRWKVFPSDVTRQRSGARCERRRHTVRSCMRPLLERLVERRDLSASEAESAAVKIFDGSSTEAEMAALLCLLRAKGETAEEVVAFASALRALMVPVELPPAVDRVLDIVGTGGDGAKTVNISTMASVLAASCGASVAKHGNRSITSRSGAADVLEATGVSLELSAEGITRCIGDAGIGFMFAPRHHPAMGRVQSVRRAMRIRTLFNFLGPLLNPARASRSLVGVYSPAIMSTMADALRRLGAEHALVVHTCGIDELSTVGAANIVEIRHGHKSDYTLDPRELGLKRIEVGELSGGDAAYNARVMREVLSGGGSRAVADVVALNAGAGLYVYGQCGTIADGVKLARETLRSGAAVATLERWIEVAASCSTAKTA